MYVHNSHAKEITYLASIEYVHKPNSSKIFHFYYMVHTTREFCVLTVYSHGAYTVQISTYIYTCSSV